MRRLLIAIAAAGLLASASSAHASPGTGTGVNVHLGYCDRRYCDTALVQSQLNATRCCNGAGHGVRYVRDGLMKDRPDQWQRLAQVAAGESRLVLIIGPEWNPVDAKAVIDQYLPGLVWAVEGQNEGPAWQAAPHQCALWQTFATNHEPWVLGASFLTYDEHRAYNQQAGGCQHFANIHPYQYNSLETDAHVEQEIAAARDGLANPNTPVVATEFGYTNSCTGRGVSEQFQKDATWLQMEKLREHGVTFRFMYELQDETSYPCTTWDDGHFGLFRWDGSEKPIVQMLRDYTT